MVMIIIASSAPMLSYSYTAISWACGYGLFCISVISMLLYVTRSRKTSIIHTSTEIHFLSVHESCTHALPRNTKYLTIDGQVYFYRLLFTDAVEPWECISRSWGALIGLHGVPGCSWRQPWPTLWIVPVQVPYWGHSTAAWVQMVALTRLRLPTRSPTALPPINPL